MRFGIGENDHAGTQRNNQKTYSDFSLCRPVAVGVSVFAVSADLKQKLRPQCDKQSHQYHNTAADNVFVQTCLLG
jgi:hypothetical protein